MTEASRIIFDRFQVRKEKEQKEAFRSWLCETLGAAGYTPQIEEVKNLFKNYNVVVGNPETAEVLCTAHYDTCAILPFPNFITPRNLPVYILYNFLIGLGLFATVFVTEFLLILLADIPAWGAMLVCYGICISFVWWMLDGKANKHTANDNTSGVLTLVEAMLALPPESRNKICFVFFDNEEKGVFGSAGFAKKYENVQENTLVLNFDCVSDGDFIQFFPSRRLKKDTGTLAVLGNAFQSREGKIIEMVCSFGFYPSDNVRFRRSCGICALHKRPWIGYYMSRIHTKRDTVLEEKNILMLRDGIVRLAQNLPVQETV